MTTLADTTAAERVAMSRASRAIGLEPLGPRVVIRIDPAETSLQTLKTDGGVATIHLPDNAQEKPYTGAIVAIGPEVTRLGVGDRVLFEKYVGVEFDVDGETLLCVKESEIIGRFRPKLS